MSGNSTMATFTASIIEYGRRKKAIRQIDKTNENNRKITELGKTDTETMLPRYENLGNVCISGGNGSIRNELISQCIKQAASSGMPTVILHEGNSHIEYDLRNHYVNHSYVRTINAANPYYDPIIRHNDVELARIMYEGAKDEISIPIEGYEFLKCIAMVCRKQGITPYIRMLGNCPFDELNEIVFALESKGVISDKEAVQLCESITKNEMARIPVEMYMAALCAEGGVLAWKSNLSKSTSIEECIKANGIISIDVESFGNKALLGLIVSEMDYCQNYGKEIRLIIDGISIEANRMLVNMLRTNGGNLKWTLVSPDMIKMTGNDDFATWIALSHKVVILKNSLKASEAFSDELGKYDRIDYWQTKAGGIDYGKFGLHMGGNDGLTTSIKREAVVKAEEITNLKDREFLLLNNNMAVLQHGTIG